MRFIRKLTSFNRGDNLAIVTPIYKKLDIILILITWGIQISCCYLRILMYSFDTSVCSHAIIMCIYFNILSNSFVFFSD